MDKNGNVKISVTGYILSYYSRRSSWSLPRGIPRDSSNPLPHNFLENRGHRETGGYGGKRGKGPRVRLGRMGRVEKRKRRGEKRGTPRAPRLGSSFLTSVRKPGEHPPLALRDTFELRLVRWHECIMRARPHDLLISLARSEELHRVRCFESRRRRSRDAPLLPETARYNAMLSRTKYAPAVIGKIGRRIAIM